MYAVFWSAHGLLAHADNNSIPEGNLDKLINEHMAAFGHVEQQLGSRLTFFEVLTALAIRYFADQDTDWVIMEAGLGGITDATNVFSPPQVPPCPRSQSSLAPGLPRPSASCLCVFMCFWYH
jgi:hypothetical protein